MLRMVSSLHLLLLLLLLLSCAGNGNPLACVADAADGFVIASTAAGNGDALACVADSRPALIGSVKCLCC